MKNLTEKNLKKSRMKEKVKSNNAITLIALVITIIVLLILAGVSIATLTGDNGLLTKAQQAKEENEKAADRDLIAMAVSEAQIGENGYQNLDETNFKKALENQLKGRDVQLSDNGDGSFIINLDNMSRMYYVDESGQVISDENMVKIATAEELKAFRDDVNSGNTYEGWYIYLANDITLDIHEEWKTVGIYNSAATTITDERNTYFSGTFDGCNHDINGIYINTENRGNGLFGIIKNGTVKNLGITNSNFIVNHNAGAITGFLQNSKIENCYSNINITTQGSDLINIGGIAGNVLENSEINNSYSTSTIVASGESSQVGGIVGGIINSAIKNCYNSGKIEGNEMVGGIAGYSNNCFIYNCYNSNNIKGILNVGSIVGLVANKGVQITNCYYLENTVNGANETEIIEGIAVKTGEQLKKLADALGEAFKEDINTINNGYPILEWQHDPTMEN